MLSDLREGLWALAHGTTLGPLQGATDGATCKSGLLEPVPAEGGASSEEGGGKEESGALPKSFYVEYAAKHLDRFRRSLGLSPPKGPGAGSEAGSGAGSSDQAGAGARREQLSKWVDLVEA